MAREKTAALIVIGNEILSGKVVDTNSAFLAGELRRLGVSLQRILVIPDEIDIIADAVREFRPRYDVVFTSGGVGPTHDDVTIAGIARGMDRPVERHPTIESQLRAHFGGEVDDARLKMAEVVQGTDLLFEGTLKFPLFQVENIYIFPGIPELFREKFGAIRERFSVDPFHMRTIYSGAPETTIAVYLNQTVAAFPELLLGSYPKMNNPEYRVRVTLESKDPDYLQRAFDALMEMLPPEVVVKTE